MARGSAGLLHAARRASRGAAAGANSPAIRSSCALRSIPLAAARDRQGPRARPCGRSGAGPWRPGTGCPSLGRL